MKNQSNIKDMNLSKYNKKELLELLKITETTKIYHLLSEELKNDRDIIKTVLKHNPIVLKEEWYTKKINQDRELVLIVLAQYGNMYKNVSESLKKDKELLMTALNTGSQFFYCIPKELKEDRDVVLRALVNDIHNSVYEYLNESYQNDEELLLKAMKINWKVIIYLSDTLLNKKEFIYKSLVNDISKNTIVSWIGEELKNELIYHIPINLLDENITKEKKTEVFIQYLEKLIFEEKLNKELCEKKSIERFKI